MMPDSPKVSIVVAIVSDTTDRQADASHLQQCLSALAVQQSGAPVEIIVPYRPPVHGIGELQRTFPQVRFLPVYDLRTHTGQVGGREHHDELRARGLAEAQGSIVGLLEDHGIASAEWISTAIEAHQQNFAAVGGAIENGIDRPLNWAVYFCDFLRYQNPIPAGESPFASDANITYKRSALEAIRPVWQEIFHETAVNGALRKRGYQIALATDMVVHQYRQNLRLISVLKERFIWGRSYAGTRSGLVSFPRRVVLAALSPALPVLILARMLMNVLKKRRNVGIFLKVLPLTALLTLAWSVGEITGYITGRANAVGAPAAEAIARKAATPGME